MLAAAALTAIALPQLVDLERHRGRIERLLGDATGWEVSLGRLDLSVLRGLALTASRGDESCEDQRCSCASVRVCRGHV